MTRGIGIGLGPGTHGLATPGDIRSFGVLADQLGFDHFWANDHLSWKDPLLDPFVLLSHIAASTKQIKLGTGVYLLPLRPAIATARSLASLDYLSAGRTIFGVGVGGEFPNEFTAASVPVSERGKRTDANLVLLRRLLAEGTVSSSDPFQELNDVTVLPTPTAEIPLIVGGRSEAALRRAATLGDGWMPYLMSARRVSAGIARMAEIAQANGRKPSTLRTIAHVFVSFAETVESGRERAASYLSSQYKKDLTNMIASRVAAGSPDDCATFVASYFAAGATDVVIRPLTRAADQATDLDKFGRSLIEILRNS